MVKENNKKQQPAKKPIGKNKIQNNPEAGNDNNGKLTQVERKFYELELASTKRSLATARKRLMFLEDRNYKLQKIIDEQEGDAQEVAKVVKKRLDEATEKENELQEFIKQMNELNDEQESKYKQHIKDTELKFKAMHDQLVSEIKLLSGKLNSLDEFRLQRDDLFDRCLTLQEEKEQLLKKEQETLFDMERQYINNLDKIRKESIERITQLTDNFVSHNEALKTVYVRRILRENTALRHELDNITKQYFDVKKCIEKNEKRKKELQEENSILSDMKVQLIKSANNKHKIIEKLTKSYEQLKEQYLEAYKYRNLYEKFMQRNTCNHTIKRTTENKLRELGQCIEHLQNDRNHLESMNEKLKNELCRMYNMMHNIKDIVYKVAHPQRSERHSSHYDLSVREQFITTLKLILNSSTEVENLLSTPSVLSVDGKRSDSSIYKVGQAGFVPLQKPSLNEIFKYEGPKKGRKFTTDTTLKDTTDMIIPKERGNEGVSVMDVELGSTLYVSSYVDIAKKMEPEGQLEGMEEEEGDDASSSSDVPVLRENPTIKPIMDLTSHSPSQTSISIYSTSISMERESMAKSEDNGLESSTNEVQLL